MLVAPIPPQTSRRPYPSLPTCSSSSSPSLSSTSTTADISASRPIMTPAIPLPPSTPSSTGSHSTMQCGLASNPTTTARPSALSRPKLTLQTSSLPRTFGSSTTGLSLSLATGPTASPTVRNTFKNAYDMAYPQSATASPSARPSSNRFSKPSSPYTSSSPYQLSIGVKSILRNSPLEPTSRRRSNSLTPGAPNSASGSRRVFFPPKKQVSYRYPLEEEIKTVVYTAQHSDLVSVPETNSCEPSSDNEDSDCSTSSVLSSESTTTSDEDAETDAPSSPHPSDKKKKKRKYQGDEQQVRTVSLMEGLEDLRIIYVYS